MSDRSDKLNDDLHATVRNFVMHDDTTPDEVSDVFMSLCSLTGTLVALVSRCDDRVMAENVSTVNEAVHEAAHVAANHIQEVWGGRH